MPTSHRHPPYPDGPFNYVEAVANATVAARSAVDPDRGYEPGEYTADAVAHSAFVEEGESVDEDSTEWKDLRDAERVAQLRLLDDIFGNPFQPASIDPTWLTSDVLALATGIYKDHAFDRMPILADALQEAGCDNDDILNHCRQPSEHVRGCWVVDLVLGKK